MNGLLLLAILAFKVRFQMVGLITLEVSKVGGVARDLPVEPELGPYREPLLRFLFYLFLSFEVANLDFYQSFIDGVVANKRDHLTVAVWGDLEPILVSELELQLSAFQPPNA